MNNFRKGALALATASAITLSGTAVAGAQTADEEPAGSASLSSTEDSDNAATGSSNLLWKIGNVLGADQAGPVRTSSDPPRLRTSLLGPLSSSGAPSLPLSAPSPASALASPTS